MIQVRSSVFETNSSSTHSICIPKKTNKTDTFIEFTIGEYGWENKKVTDTASYLYTSILCAYNEEMANNKLDELKSILNNHSIGYSFEKRQYDKWGIANGYVDHGYLTRNFIEAVLNDEDMLLRYLFDGVVYTGNDNECVPDGCNICNPYMWGYENNEWFEEPNPYHDPDNFDYFYKGN